MLKFVDTRRFKWRLTALLMLLVYVAFYLQTVPDKIPRDTLLYFETVDEKLSAWVDAIKSISEPYFEENLTSPSHPILAVNEFRP